MVTLESLLSGQPTADGAAVVAAFVRANGGVRAVTTPSTRKAAGQNAPRSQSLEFAHVCARLERGGLVEAPDYSLYMGVPLLRGWADDTASNTIAATATGSAAERFDIVRRFPEVMSCDQYGDLENKISKTIDDLRSATFGHARPLKIGLSTIEAALLPESAVAAELVFMAVTQACETLFLAAAELLQRAFDAISYADAASAEFNLNMAGRVLATLQAVGRPLSWMKVSAWLELRPAIVDPSAIQSRSFRAMKALLREFPDRIVHDRYAPSEMRRIAGVFSALEEVIEAVRRWNNQHYGYAHRYAALNRDDPIPPNLTHLKKRDDSWLCAVEGGFTAARELMCGVGSAVERRGAVDLAADNKRT